MHLIGLKECNEYNGFDDIRNEFIQKMELTFNSVKDNLGNLIVSKFEDLNKHVQTKVSSSISYATVAIKPKSSLILQPKDTNQSTNITKSEPLTLLTLMLISPLSKVHAMVHLLLVEMIFRSLSNLVNLLLGN